MSFFVSRVCAKCRKPHYPVKVQLEYESDFRNEVCSDCKKQQDMVLKEMGKWEDDGGACYNQRAKING